VSSRPRQTPQLESGLTRIWMRRGVAACVLFPISLLFRVITALRRALYRAGILRSERVPVPVIVVGNIFIGGTGKTPLVIWLVQALRQAGYVPGVISRGYGASSDDPLEVTPISPARDVGDEPALIAARTGAPLFTCRNRPAAARALLQHHREVDVIVSDDGLQHYALQRDLEIMLFDARGVGNGWLLPAGPLREPPSRLADFTVVNAHAVPQGLADDDKRHIWRMELVGVVAERLSDPLERMTLSALAANPSKKLLAAAGIGNPARFFAMLRNAGLQFDALPLPDHHDFSDRPFDDVNADIILITEKDAVKCRHIEHLKDDPRLWVVPVTARIDGALADRIVEKLRGHPTA
jgi:tetraacyldisaccharide 4'-kinase